MPKIELGPLARKLRDRGLQLKQAGPLAQMRDGPQLVEDTAGFMVQLADLTDELQARTLLQAEIIVELAKRVDALTPYIDEGGAE